MSFISNKTNFKCNELCQYLAGRLQCLVYECVCVQLKVV